MAVITIGVVLLLAAAVGFYFMRRARDELHAMIGAETLPVNELELLRKASDDVGARGGFRKECEVVGAAH
ncbi:helicase, partial [Saccharopolyspora sp. NPDC000995]